MHAAVIRPVLRALGAIRSLAVARMGYLLPLAVASAARAGAGTFARAHRISLLVRGEHSTWADRLVQVLSVRRAPPPPTMHAQGTDARAAVAPQAALRGVALLESASSAIDVVGSAARAVARGAARVQERESRREAAVRGQRAAGLEGGAGGAGVGVQGVESSASAQRAAVHSVPCVLPDVPSCSPLGPASAGSAGSPSSDLGGAKCPVCFESICAGRSRGGRGSIEDDEEEQPACAYPCGHVLCWECGVQWVSQKGSCPMCRQTATTQELLALQQ